MVACVFGPDGIVIATQAMDRYFEVREEDEQRYVSTIDIPGHPHTFIFWNRICLTYNFMTPYSYDSNFLSKLSELENRWSEIPKLEDFMPYLKQLVVENNYQIIGIVSTYEKEGFQSVPYVYQILGQSIRRINIDSRGKMIYNYACLEINPLLWKLFQRVKIQNGDEWELAKEIHMRCDLFSIDKSIDFCCFLIKTGEYVNNINTSLFRCPSMVEIVVNKPTNFELNKITI